MKGKAVPKPIPKNLPILRELLETKEKQLREKAEILGEFNVRILDLSSTNHNLRTINTELKEIIKSKDEELWKEKEENRVITTKITQMEAKLAALRKMYEEKFMNNVIKCQPIKGVSELKTSTEENYCKKVSSLDKDHENEDAPNPQDSELINKLIANN